MKFDMFFWTSFTQYKPKVELPDGIILGSIDKTIYGQEYYRFEGIPYAQPPIGKLRFMSPEPVIPWNSELDCTKPGNKPLQYNIKTGKVEGDEDCLCLNVYTKYHTCPKLLPVMVFVQGGSYCMGEATRDLYSPDYFMFKDVVLVTFNYRLDSLGFLSLKMKELCVPGNAALRDSIMAIIWVSKNISLFNGDPKNITLFGMSAGAAIVHYLTMVEDMKNIFHKVIIMSGSVLNYWANLPQKNFAYRLACSQGYKGVEDDDESILKFLQKLPGKNLVVHQLLTMDEINAGYTFSFGPVIEPYITSKTVIRMKPLELVRQSWGNDIPMILGGASFEGLVAYPVLLEYPQSVQVLYSQPLFVLPPDMDSQMLKDLGEKISEMLMVQHFGTTTENKSENELKMQYMDMVSYRNFWLGINRTALGRIYRGTKHTYLYRFDFDSPNFNQQRYKLCGDAINRGVAHADELSYLFYAKTAWKLELDSPEFLTIKRMIGMWYAFAKTSNPNCSEIGNVKWRELSNGMQYKTLNIGKELVMVELPEKRKLEIWQKCYPPNELL